MVKQLRKQRAVYFTDEEHKEITKEANKKGLSFAVYVRLKSLKK